MRWKNGDDGPAFGLVFACALFSGTLGTAAAASELPKAKPVCKGFATANSYNRYALLMLFDASLLYKQNIRDLFGFQDTAPFGCISDPTPEVGGPTGLIVQGGCPTDCRHSGLYDIKAKRPKRPAGDPLSYAKASETPDQKPPTWGIWFADPGGAAEAAVEDPQSHISVWQILARDACHAGRILKSVLHTDEMQKTLIPKGAYRGQMMIGYDTYGSASTESKAKADEAKAHKPTRSAPAIAAPPCTPIDSADVALLRPEPAARQ